MHNHKQGFTIVELIVVIIVIALLAAVAIFGYGAWRKDIQTNQVKSDLTAAVAAMEDARNFSSAYPTVLPATVVPSNGVVLSGGGIGSAGTDFCIDATHQNDASIKYYATATSGGAVAGSCATTWNQVAAGRFHACALNMKGVAYCWGRNNNGAIGNNTTSTTNVVTPVPVYTGGALSGKTITDIDADEEVTCVLADGSPYCWGVGTSGQLGNGTMVSSSAAVTVDVSGVLAGKKIAKIAVGPGTVCVLANNFPYCWGTSWQGQLGNGTTLTTSSTPVAVNVSGLSVAGGFSDIDVSSHVCAVSKLGAVYCWGAGSFGRLGNGTTPTSAPLPVAVDMSGVMAGKKAVHVTVGYPFSCALTTDATPYCWGGNDSGRLGNGTTTDSSVPVAVTTTGDLSGKKLKKLSASGNGYNHICAISEDGLTYCWGNNSDGQAGVNTTTNVLSPLATITTGVLANKVAVDVSTGDQSCVAASGRIYCWGSGGSGQLGNGGSARSLVPVQTTLPY